MPKAGFQPGVALSPDAARVAYSGNPTGRFGLWVAPVDGGAPECLVEFADRAVRQIAWAPDGKSLVFTADRDGDEQYQIYRVSSDGGPPERLSPADDRQYRLAADPYDPSGRHLVYAANDRDETVQDLVVRDLESGGERRYAPEEKTSYLPAQVSPDGRWLLVEGFSASFDSDCYLLDLATPDARPVRVTDGSAYFHPLGWTADSTGFYLLTTAWGEFVSAARYSLGDGSLRPVVTAGWDVETVREAGDTLLWAVNENGRSVLEVRRGDADPARLPLPAGVVHSIGLSRDGRVAALQLETATRPAEIAVLDLATGVLRHLTDSRPPGLTAVPAVEPEDVTFTARDGRTVHGLLYRPHGEGPFPVVMWIHGGPEHQERRTYERSGLYQYLLHRGIGVYAPNVAGSTGYGVAYRTLVYRDWGGVDLADFADARAYLESVSWVDAGRLAVAGASYGGFAALSCLTRLPGPWRAGVSLYGPSNLVTLATACPPTWRTYVNTVLGDPVADERSLTERSPLSHVDRLTAPLLVVQGARDPRVPRHESDQIVARLRDRDVDVRYTVYENEGHGFTDRDTEIAAHTEVAEFLAGHLGAG